MAQPTTVVNPSPRSQFRSNVKSLAEHNNAMQSPATTLALNMALLQYQRDLLGKMSDANAAAAVSFKLKGAEEFIAIYLTLGLDFTPKVIADGSQLDYKA